MTEPAADLTGRWKGRLGPREKDAFKYWIRAVENRATIDTKVGKERSRVEIRFNREELTACSRRAIGAVAMMMASDEAASATGGVEALAELAGADEKATDGELVRRYSNVLLREWTAEAAQALQMILPQTAGLRLDIGLAEDEELPDISAKRYGLLAAARNVRTADA